MVVQFGNDSSTQETLKLKKSSDTVYTFEYFSPVDKNLTIEPQLTEDANLLFYPKRKDIAIEDECVTNIVFEAKTGLVIIGAIDPPTEGVNIRIINSKTLQEVVTVKTDTSGKYKVGPLYDDQVYEVEASKEDYVFKKEGNNFKAQKLSSLTVTIKDQSGNPLESVFV